MLVPLCHYFFYISIKNAEAELGADNQKIRVLPRQHMRMMECERNHRLIIGYYRLFVNMFVDKYANNWYIYQLLHMQRPAFRLEPPGWRRPTPRRIAFLRPTPEGVIMSEGDIRCGDNCILRRLSNGQHYVTTPSEAPTGSSVYECNFDSDLRYQILSHGTVVIHRKSQCPSC